MPRAVARLLSIGLGLACATSQGAEPKLDLLLPPGGQRGQQVAVTASGTFERWPVRVWVDRPGVAFEPQAEKGKLVARIAPDALPGLCLVRLFDEQGASAPRPFLVGTLAELTESEPNDDLERAGKIERPQVVVNGRLGKRGDVDTFRIEMKKDQTLVAALDAHRRLGSPLDGVLQIITEQGFVQAQVDDDPELDPTLVFTATTDGPIYVRLFGFPSKPDSSISLAGGSAFAYRLTLTTSGYLKQTLPLAVDAGRHGHPKPTGWNLSHDLPELLVDPVPDSDRAVVWHPSIAGEVVLPVVHYPCLVEDETTTSKSGELPIPACITGRIDPPGDHDSYRVSLRKGEAYRFRVDARSLGSPLDPVLQLLDGTGKLITEQDDTDGRDVELSHKDQNDGSYQLVIRDLNGQGGPRSIYRLTAMRPHPDFELELAEDHVSLAPGNSVNLKVKVSRRDGFTAAVDCRCADLPPGVSAAVVRSEAKGSSAAEVTLAIKAAAQAAPFSGPFRVVGEAAGIERRAMFPVAGLERSIDRPWLTVTSRR
jgi:hypothetical protein